MLELKWTWTVGTSSAWTARFIFMRRPRATRASLDSQPSKGGNSEGWKKSSSATMTRTKTRARASVRIKTRRCDWRNKWLHASVHLSIDFCLFQNVLFVLGTFGATDHEARQKGIAEVLCVVNQQMIRTWNSLTETQQTENRAIKSECWLFSSM